MPARCCVFGCSSVRNKSLNENYSFHGFPSRDKSPKRFELWLSEMNRNNFTPAKHSFVCSKHFKDDDYELTTLLKQQLMPNNKFLKTLKKTAVPSLFLKEKPEKRKRNLLDKPKKKVVKKKSKQNGDNVDLTTPTEQEIQCELGREVLRELGNNIETAEVTYKTETDYKMSEDDDESNTEETDNEDSLEVNLTQDIPKYVCNNCFDDLNHVYNFRLRCLKNIATANENLQEIEELDSLKNISRSCTDVNSSEGYAQSNNKISGANKTNYKNTEQIEECNERNLLETVYIKAENIENLENEDSPIYDGNEQEYFVEEYLSINTTDKTSSEENKCSECNETFTKASLLQQHRCVCTTRCKSSTQSHNITRHTHTHIGSPLACDVCNREFRYTNHKRISSFKCTACNKTSTERSE